ncbi:MAG: alpha/beta hydrolase [Acidimicrobiia bacterium]
MRSRVWTGIVALAIAAVTIQPVRAGSPQPAAAPGAYLAQWIDWKPCFDPKDLPAELPEDGDALECGSYLVPRDWSAPGVGVDLTIAVSRLRSPARRAERSLLTNPGGPGGPGRTMPLLFLERHRAAVLAHFEIIGIDVRGTGDSTNVTCGNQSQTGATLDPRDRRPTNLDLILDASVFVARVCQDASGGLDPFITTEQTVRDLDLLRVLLGRQRIDWVGYSGGTWLGAYYATYFPERVDRFVLDANAEFTAPWQQAFAHQPLGFQRRFDVDFLPYVAAYPDYFGLGDTPEAVRRSYEALRARLAAEPLEIAEGFAVYPPDLDFLITGALYSTTGFQSAAEDIRTLRDAAGGGAPEIDARMRLRRQALAGRVLRARQLARAGGTLPLAPDAFQSTFNAITCNDTPWQGDRASLIAESQRQGEAHPLVGWYALSNSCIFWDRPPVELKVPNGIGVPPVLMVQTERDPATPMEGARRAAQGFAGARLLTVVGDGDHATYAIRGNECVDNTVEAYLIDGIVPAEGATCPGLPVPPPVPLAGDPDEVSGVVGSVLDSLAQLADLVGPLPL